jgi:hypothetical protein
MENSHPALELLEQRLTLLRRLAQSLEDAQQAIVRGDLTLLEQETSAQQAMCCEWQRLPFSTGTGNRCDSLHPKFLQIEQQTRQVELRLRHLVRVHAALLHGAQACLGVLANLVPRTAGTYEAPGSTVRPASRREEGVECRI